MTRRLAAAGLALVLVVVLASAAIRHSAQDLGGLLPVVRGTHRVSASLATLLVLAAGWLAWRAGRRALAAAIVLLTVGLSVLGAATGVAPPPPAQAGNLLGGFALAAALAWLLREDTRALSGGAATIMALVAVQVLLGAWLSIFAEELWSAPLLAHATLGLGIAGSLLWLSAFRRAFLGALAILLPASGFASALLGQPLAASLAHAAAAALLIVAVARAHGRFA